MSYDPRFLALGIPARREYVPRPQVMQQPIGYLATYNAPNGQSIPLGIVSPAAVPSYSQPQYGNAYSSQSSPQYGTSYQVQPNSSIQLGNGTTISGNITTIQGPAIRTPFGYVPSPPEYILNAQPNVWYR